VGGTIEINGEPAQGPAARGRTNARGDATRELILLTAERLFAERGIEAVPLRDIGVAAGQKNNVAVQYHFGDRETLVQAIAAHRAKLLAEINSNIIADVVAGGRAPTIEDMVRAFILALAVNLDDESHFLPFVSRYIIERGGYAGLDRAMPSGSIDPLRTIMYRLLPDLPRDIHEERWQVLMTSAVHTLARYQVAMRLDELPAPIDDLIDDLVRFLTAGLTAPVRATAGSARGSARRPKPPTAP
jgi:AcrR family transcriptional regulator